MILRTHIWVNYMIRQLNLRNNPGKVTIVREWIMVDRKYYDYDSSKSCHNDGRPNVRA